MSGKCRTHSRYILSNYIFFWRRERESNPRYTFVGIHTISSRAPSAARTSLPEKQYFFISIKNFVNLKIMDSRSEAGMTAIKNFGGERGIRPICIGCRVKPSKPFTAFSLCSIYNFGGERGIRTPVGACGPQIDFESIPLRPLRYLSAFLSRRRSGCGCYPLFPKKSTHNFSALFP